MKVYTITEVSKILKVSRVSIYSWIKENKLKYSVLPNGKKRINEEELKKYTGGN